MIYDASTFPGETTLHADLCVVGSGAGGSMAAMVAAEAGLKVVLLEAGELVLPETMNQREEQMLPRLLWESGGLTTDDRAVRIHQGRAVGGSTVHNLNLCKRAPEPVLAEWARTRGLAELGTERWRDLYGRVEALLEVSDLSPEDWNRHNQLLATGCDALGWRWGSGRHNRTGCNASGFCEVGCAFDAKNNSPKMLLPRFLAAGGEIVTRCQASRIEAARGRVTGVEAVALGGSDGRPGQRVSVSTDRVCVAASATGTAALLLRSRLGLPDDSVGATLRIHPALLVAGDFEDPVNAWRGIPQAVECTEFLDFEAAHRPDSPGTAPLGTRNWILNAFAHPMGTATFLTGYGQDHQALMSRYAHMVVLTNVVHDFTSGRVRPRGDLGLSITYRPDAADRTELVFGLARSAELLFAAGATRVTVPTDPMTVLDSAAEAAALADWDLRPGKMEVTAVHPMGTVPMGDDPRTAAVDGWGRCHHVDGLWVADGSLFPTSIGGPPQLSIYALGLHVGEGLTSS